MVFQRNGNLIFGEDTPVLKNLDELNDKK